MPFTISITALRNAGACKLDEVRLFDLAHVLGRTPQKDEPISLDTWWSLPSTGIGDMVWSLRVAEPHSEVLPLMSDFAEACAERARAYHEDKPFDVLIARWTSNIVDEASRVALIIPENAAEIADAIFEIAYYVRAIAGRAAAWGIGDQEQCDDLRRIFLGIDDQQSSETR